MNNKKLFYKDKPLFGLDIGYRSLKVMQTEKSNKQTVVTGYGVKEFELGSINNGEIVDPEKLAKAAFELFDKHVVGKITTRRVAATIPARRAYTRTMSLPDNLSGKQITDAVHYEAEQYIPVPIDELYLDYVISGRHENNIDVMVVAAPKRMIDSYVQFMKLLGLEICALETTISASSRLVAKAEGGDTTPTILIDFGSVSCDITVYDKALIVSGTIIGGGDNFTEAIAKKLNVSKAEAAIIKAKYGLSVSKKQADIIDALSPILGQLIKEIQRVMRYFEDKTGNESKIGQIITMGGGANMPGLSEYLINQLRLPARLCDPWLGMTFGNLEAPAETEKAMFVTVAGVSLINPKELWQ